ncbi:acyl-CoA carboxylase epsilon subunit [Micromonospora sp. URMC 105]|uniref:acyl-CoA carboxylase epsilon subunit n=1 Tax=Micromonospora sp. URMC 105 TaxID=3423413 RepID=UPI003F1C0BAF
MTGPEEVDPAAPVARLVVLRGAPTEEELAAATVALMCSLRAARDGTATVSRRAEASWSAAVDYRAPGAWASRCH